VAFREKIDTMIGLPGSGRRGFHALATATPLILVPRPWAPAGTGVPPLDAAPGRAARSRTGDRTGLVTPRAGAISVAC
jgi:hypothetical protein